MGGPSGSSGTPSNTSGQAVSYQPTAQPQADTGFQSLLGGFFGGLGPAFQGMFGGSSGMFSGTPGGVSYGMAAPFVGGAGSGTITDPNNPQYLQALQGALAAASGAGNTVNLGNFVGNDVLPSVYGTTGGGTGNLVSYLQPTLGNVTQANVQQGQGAQSTLNNAANQIGSLANNYVLTSYPGAQGSQTLLNNAGNTVLQQLFPEAVNNAQNLNTASGSILNTGFDPQNALFNQLQNQVSQQAQAANAAAGLGGSAYGASTAGNTLSNFDINWQNQQLARQAQALSSASSGYEVGGALPAAVAQSGGNLYNLANQIPASVLQAGTNIQSALPSIYAGGQALTTNPLSQGGAIQSAIDQLAYQPSADLLSQASSIPSLLQGGATLAGLPYNTQSTGANNALSLLSNYSNLGNQQYAIPQQLANNLESYLQLGQSASNLSGQLGALGQQELGSSLAGIGSALGTGSNLLFGNQGLSGALGLGSSGLLGGSNLASIDALGASAPDLAGASAIGSVAGPAAGDLTLAGGADVAAGGAAASGGGFSLGSLLPFGAS